MHPALLLFCITNYVHIHTCIIETIKQGKYMKKEPLKKAQNNKIAKVAVSV